MNPVVEVLRCIAGPTVGVYSYRDKKDFATLWGREFKPSARIVVVFDGIPASSAEQSGLNLADRVTAFDWVAWLALRHQMGSRVMLLDLASHRHPGSFAVHTLPLLLPDLPWVSLYRVFGIPQEHKLLEVLSGFGDEQDRLLAQVGRDGFSINRLLTDLAEDRPLPFPAGEAVEPVNRIKELWGQALTRAHGRHEVANLISPLILADAMAVYNDRGARQLLGELVEDVLIGAFCRLLRELGLLGKLNLEELPKCPELATEHVPRFDAFERFQKVRFLLVDDQARIGYARLLSVMLGGAAGPAWATNAATWKHSSGKVSIHAETSPEILLEMLKSAATSNEEWRKLRVLGKDCFDILFLDLRLLPDAGAGPPSNDEIRFLSRLIAIYETARPADEWTKRAFDAAKSRLDNGPDSPLQWALLPLLLCAADQSVPIVIFSSTHQRDIIAALKSKPNVVTSFAKPLLSGYGESSFDLVRQDLREAVKSALELHEKRTVWERFTELKPWVSKPIYKIKLQNKIKGQKDEPYNLPGTENTFPPRIFAPELQLRLAAYFCEHLLWERYIESLSAPFELLEAALLPDIFLDEFAAGAAGVTFARDGPDYAPMHGPIARALTLIRHKKAHGHALHGGMVPWQGWNDRTQLVAVILLFLADFIEQAQLTKSGNRPSGDDPTIWDEYCLKIAWKLFQHEHVRSFLKNPGSSPPKIHPNKLTTDNRVLWEDVTIYTLAIGCREVANNYDVSMMISWRALEKIVDQSVQGLCLGRIVSDPAQNPVSIEKRDRTPVVCNLRFIRPSPRMNEWVVFKDVEARKDPEDDWALGLGCLPEWF